MTKKREITNADRPMGQPESIAMPGLGVGIAEAPLHDPVITPVDHPLVTQQAEALEFNEEPIKIMIHRGTEQHAETHQFCQVQGKGAEILFPNGKWVPCNYIAKGVPFVTKRKYVEALCMARHVAVSTEMIKHEGENRDPENRLNRVSTPACTFSVLEDKNPKGVEWLNRILAGKY